MKHHPIHLHPLQNADRAQGVHQQIIANRMESFLENKLVNHERLFASITKLGLLCMLMLLGVNGAIGQIYSNTFTGTSNCPTNGNTPTMVTNSTGTAVSRATVTCSATANVFSSTTLNVTSSVSNTSYIEFSATANSGFILNLTSVSFFRQGSNSAPNQIEVRYSTDGFSTSTNWGSAPNTPTSGTTATWDFTDFSTGNAGTVTFRIYPYGTTRCDLGGGAASSTGTFRVDNVTINGTVTSSTTAPIVISTAATSIGTTGATLNGEVTSDGGAAISDRGFVYKTTAGVTISDNKTTVAGTTGAFTLTPVFSVNTQYYFKAYAINTVGTTLSSPELNFYTLANTPITPTVNNPTSSTLDVTLGVGDGNPSATQYAIQETTGGLYVQANGSLAASEAWQTAGSWGTKTVTGLAGGTPYTFQVKARNGANFETSFGSMASETTTSALPPTINSPTSAGITNNAAILGGTVTSDGGSAITPRGVVWAQTSLNNDPFIGGANTTDLSTGGTTGIFTVNVTSLPVATQISYKAYATNSEGTSYTTPVSTFYTLADEPSIQATDVTFNSIGSSSFTVGWTNGDGAKRAVFMREGGAGSITNPTDATTFAASTDWTAKGDQLGASGYYCIYNGTGNSVSMSNLTSGVIYFVQVFEYNDDGFPTAATTNYFIGSGASNPGNAYSLSTEPFAHSTTFSSSALTPTSIELSFDAATTISNATGYLILQRTGSAAPTGLPADANGYSLTNNIGDGTVVAIITNTATTSATIIGLSFATEYSYTLIPFNWDGNNIATYNYKTDVTVPSASATTPAASAPIVTTPTHTAVLTTTATLGGNVTDDGGDPVTERGIVWAETSLNPDPLIDGLNVTKVITSGTTGVFTIPVTSLPSGVSISYKAYAINSTGTGYTAVEMFSTLDVASQLAFVAAPSTGAENTNLTSFTVEARRPDNTVDITYGANITITKASGPGNLSGTLTKPAVNGIATFNDLQFDVLGTYTITANSGLLSSATSGNIQISGATLANDYFRSNTTGNWNAAGTWESSHDNASWFVATSTPTSTANTITIRNGNTVSSTVSVAVDQVVIENGGTLSITGGTFTVSNGAGDDISIENGGVFNLSTSGPAFNVSATVNVNTDGIVRISTSGLTSNGSGVNASNFVYQNGAIIDYTLTTPFSASAVTYFPNVNASTVPIFRISSSITTNPGGGSNTVINGILELGSGVNFTWTGAGTKTFRNGITGSGSCSQGSAGAFLINGAISELSGSGTITLGTNGLSISGGTCSMLSNKTINSNTITIANTAILAMAEFKLNGSSAVTVANGGTLKVGSLNASGAISDNITGTLTLNSGSTVEFYGSGPQLATARTFSNLTINNINGVTLLGDVTVNGTLTLTSGNITTDLNKVITASGASISRTSGYIAGNLQLRAANGSNSFPIGSTSTYTPVTLDITGVSGSVDITSFVTSGNHPNEGTSPIDPTKKANHYWTLTKSGAGTFTSYISSFDVTNTTNTGTVANYKVAKFEAGWSAAGGNATGNMVTSASFTSFGDFIAGEESGCLNVALASATAVTSPICSNATTTLTYSGLTGTDASVTWYDGQNGTGNSYGTGTPSAAVGPGTYYAYAIGTCGSPMEIQVVVGGTSTSLPTTVGSYTATYNHIDGAAINYNDVSCKLLSRIEDASGGNELGSTTVNVVLTSTYPLTQTSNAQTFGGRKVTVTPASGGTATLTLYYAQSDFTFYNGGNGTLDVPSSGSNSDPNIGNLRIAQVTVGGNLDNFQAITPSSVTWNGSENRWEIVLNNVTLGSAGSDFYFYGPEVCNLTVENNSIMITNISETSANVSWDAVNGATGYVVRWRTGVEAWSTSVSFVPSKNLTFLNGGITYEVQIRAICNNGYGLASNSVGFTTLAALPECSVPMGLSATGITSNGALIVWNAVSNSNVSYTIRWRVASPLGSWSQATTAITSRNLSPWLLSGTTYDIQVRTNCSGAQTNQSAWSPITQFTTLAPLPECSVPMGLSATGITSNGALIVWNAVSNSNVSYTIRWRVASPIGPWSQANTNLTSRNLNPWLLSGTTYDIQVRTNCSGAQTNQSTWSPIVQFSTNSQQGSQHPLKDDVYLLKESIASSIMEPMMSNSLTEGSIIKSSIINNSDNINISHTHIYPNPTSDLLNLSFESEQVGDAQISMMDVSGRIAKEMKFSTVEGFNTIQISLEDLSHGVYMIQISASGTRVYTGRVIKIE